MSQYGQTPKFLKLSRLAFGSFIEFGCADGVRDSNTHMLECMGWKGFCIEPVETVMGRKHAYAGAVCPPNQSSVDIVVASLNGLHGANPDLKSAGQMAKKVQKTNFTFKARFPFRNGRGGGDMLYYRKQ